MNTYPKSSVFVPNALSLGTVSGQGQGLCNVRCRAIGEGRGWEMLQVSEKQGWACDLLEPFLC